MTLFSRPVARPATPAELARLIHDQVEADIEDDFERTHGDL
jgi:hypothetical protein